MNFKRPVLMSVLWLPALWLAGVQPPNAPRPVAETQAVTPTIAAKPQTTLLFPEKELCGEYYYGDGLGVNCSLTLTADHRFTFGWRGCLGLYDENSGAWEMQGDVAVMRPEKPNKQEGFRGMNTRFVPVKWGKRYYLIDENGMPGFCAAAHDGKFTGPNALPEEVHGSDYTRVADGKVAPLYGKPLLPERYLEFYQQGAVTAKVARIDAQGQAILHVGAANRVKTGMLFTVNSWDGVDLKVLSIKGHEAVCKVMYWWNSDEWVKAGRAFTTGTNFDRPSGTGSQTFDAPPKAAKPAAK